MQTRKDLYQAYRFMQQRLGLALLRGEPDLPESPMRRHNVATFCGIMVGVLVLAGFGVWGLISKGGATALDKPGQLLIDEDTGASYVFDQRGRRLVPVANYASARLILDTPDVVRRAVSGASLAGYPRAPMVGIPGAPAWLPEPKRLVRGPWSVCVRETGESAGRPQVTLLAGPRPGGRALGGTGDALLVQGEDGQPWLVWADRRMRVTQQAARALSDAAPRRVPGSWLNALPAGPDFAAPEVPERGREVTGPGGRPARVGQIFTVPSVAGGAARWYVQLADGLAPVSAAQATMLILDPGSRAAYGKADVAAIPLDAATANSAPPSKIVLRDDRLPSATPRIAVLPVNEPLCVVYADTARGSTRAVLSVGGVIPAGPAVRPGTGPGRFDQVVLPPGGAILAGLLPGEGRLDAVRSYWIVTDQGQRFALTSPDLIEKLGYQAKDVAPMPGNLLQMIPEGPALDPARAALPVSP
ncbi:type VII secretion protein EccB [Bailinhaonella thermotolerans]|uniref:Type VII secretion protein EccB n=2 Tax=Bailinhaonella thermotolerans TaxID=1070861 RepID=A0A3A4AY17_9ACTN|nr:type VII secretion protein EccB [Bailinhaonella thermotolerans]